MATPTPAIIATPERPTPEQIDQFVEQYFDAETSVDIAELALAGLKKRGIDLASQFGVVPPNAENSRKLEGKLTALTVTISNTISVEEDRVQDLKAALEADGYGPVFDNIFRARVRHEIIDDPEKAILAAGMPKRVTEKAFKMFGRCVTAKKKAPTLKVARIVEKPARKPRAKKATAAEAGA